MNEAYFLGSSGKNGFFSCFNQLFVRFADGINHCLLQKLKDSIPTLLKAVPARENPRL